MLSSLNPSAQQFLNRLNQTNDRLQAAQLQISSGLKITQVSDAPDSIAPLLQARANLSGLEQNLTNLGQVKSEVDSGEQALENAVSLFDSVQTLGTTGATGTQTAENRAGIAQQIDSVLQEMLALSNTSVGGRYIFSGDTDQQNPYTYDPTQTNPISAYLGSASTRVAQDPNGTTFPVSLTAQQIFDSPDPTTNVFTAIQTLSAALKANDTTAITNAVSGLSKVSPYLNAQLATYGNTQDRVADATSFGQNLQLQIQTQISGLANADSTESILEFTQAQIQEQAALQSRAQIPRQTLFDYLA